MVYLLGRYPKFGRSFKISHYTHSKFTSKYISQQTNPKKGIQSVRSWLFATKTQDGLTKAASSGADVIVLDLEDSVPTHMKSKMRLKYRQAIDSGLFDGNQIFVRLNSHHCYEEMLRDIKSMTIPGVKGFLLSKMDNVGFLKYLEALTTKHEENENLPVGSICFAPIIETPEGYYSAKDIAQGSIRNIALISGTHDFMTYCRGTSESSPFDALVSQVSIAAAMANIPAISGVCDFIDDHAAIQKLYSKMKACGYQGAVTLTLNQVVLANREFSPTPPELQWAKSILAEGISTIQMSIQQSRQMVGPPHKSKAIQIINSEIGGDTSVSKLNHDILYAQIPTSGVQEMIQVGSTIPSPLELTITEFHKGAWESSFLTTNPINTSQLNIATLGGTTISFLMLNLLAMAMSVSTFSENARVHLGSYRAMQLLPVHVAETLTNACHIDHAVHKKNTSNEVQYTIVDSTHKLLNQNKEVVFSVCKRTMFGPLAIKEASGNEKEETHKIDSDAINCWSWKTKVLANSSSISYEDKNGSLRLNTNDLLLHKDSKVFGKSETRSLCKLFKIVNDHHHNIVRYRDSELLVPGPFVIAGMVSNAERDIGGHVIHEEYHTQTNINKVNFEDQISTATYVTSINRVPGYPHLEEITLKHIGLKNTDIEWFNETGLPAELFQQNNHIEKPSDYEKFCAQHCPLLYRKIACVAERTVIRISPF